ncbi:MAG: hypothetical protein ABW166_21855 [Sedimenticola sp.]
MNKELTVAEEKIVITAVQDGICITEGKKSIRLSLYEKLARRGFLSYKDPTGPNIEPNWIPTPKAICYYDNLTQRIELSLKCIYSCHEEGIDIQKELEKTVADCREKKSAVENPLDYGCFNNFDDMRMAQDYGYCLSLWYR